MNVKHWHVAIPGYTQDYGTSTGLERIWGALDDVLAETGPGVRVLYFPWNSPWKKIASFIKRHSAEGPCVRVYAYSFGAGYGFVTLAKELHKLGIGIRHAVLCDPVWRRPGLPVWTGPIGSLESIWRNGKLPIPASVDEVTWCYQRNNRPDGDEPVAAKGARTIIHTGTQLMDAVHATADDSDWFKDAALRVALEPPVAGEQPEAAKLTMPEVNP